MNRTVPHLILVALALLGARAVDAAVSLPSIFSEHAVLMRSDRVPVWGKATPGEQIGISLGKATATAVAGADGAWKASLDLHAEGPGPHELIVKGGTTLVVSDVLVGEVWLCSGQSNMALPLGETIHGQDEVARSANSQLRQFLVNCETSLTPRATAEGRWTVASVKDSRAFSAVGYYFAKRLHADLAVPVGLINATCGGSAIESWVSPKAFAIDPELKASAEESLRDAQAEQGSDGKPRPLANRSRPVVANLFNAMIHPIIPYAISGTIWYQGESNVTRACQYLVIFQILIRDWREQWGRGEFPFYFCQLPAYEMPAANPGDHIWAEMREAQSKALALANTGQAITIDLGEALNIHPGDKQDVGERLARIALAKSYGKPMPYAGPAYERMVIEGERIRISFTHADGGLVAKPIPDSIQPDHTKPERVPLTRHAPTGQLEGFAVCGSDRVWAWAEAVIEGNEVVVHAAAVPKPMAVRYAWTGYPVCNLYNGAGLPAEPFRSDHFDLMTLHKNY